jgi:hypothetical protein
MKHCVSVKQQPLGCFGAGAGAGAGGSIINVVFRA